METITQLSLYERLGGAAGIKPLVDDIVEAHMNNPIIKERFVPYREKPEQLAAIKKHICDFFGAGSGGLEQYTGREMQIAHQGMNITEEEYTATVEDIMGVLDKYHKDEQTKNDVLGITEFLKNQIINL